MHIEQVLFAVYLPLNNPRAGLKMGRIHSDLSRSEWYDSHRLEQIQKCKLQILIQQIRDHVPFYKTYPPWREDQSEMLRDQLAKYPILTKDKIRADTASMRQSGLLPRFISKRTTGGTTGTPIEVWRVRHHMAIVDAAFWRGMGWIGIKPWTRCISAHGFSNGSWYGRFRLRLANRRLVDGFVKSADDRRLIADQIRRFNPAYVTGYVSDVIAIGQACKMAGVKVKSVVTTGEMLYPHQRGEIERLYGAKASSYYGCNEVGAMAFECEHGRMHVADEHVILEVVNDDGMPIWDQPGRILLTDLDNFLTPFIRYEVGDMGVLTRNPCPCGRGLTVLQSLEGRVQDALINESGGQLSTLFFAGRFRNLKAIHRLQLVQRSLSEVDLLYEGDPMGLESELKIIIQEIHQRLGKQMIIRTKAVEHLIHTERGKCRLIVSL